LASQLYRFPDRFGFCGFIPGLFLSPSPPSRGTSLFPRVNSSNPRRPKVSLSLSLMRSTPLLSFSPKDPRSKLLSLGSLFVMVTRYNSRGSAFLLALFLRFVAAPRCDDSPLFRLVSPRDLRIRRKKVPNFFGNSLRTFPFSLSSWLIELKKDVLPFSPPPPDTTNTTFGAICSPTTFLQICCSRS